MEKAKAKEHILIDITEWPESELLISAALRLEKDSKSLSQLGTTKHNSESATYNRAADFLRYLANRRNK